MADGSSGRQSPLRRGLKDSEDDADAAAACDQLVVARAENGTAFYLYNHQVRVCSNSLGSGHSGLTVGISRLVDTSLSCRQQAARCANQRSL